MVEFILEHSECLDWTLDDVLGKARIEAPDLIDVKIESDSPALELLDSLLYLSVVHELINLVHDVEPLPVSVHLSAAHVMRRAIDLVVHRFLANVLSD